MFAGVPIGSLILSRFPKLEPFVFGLLIFLTCDTEDINFVSMEWYRGTAKGFEISMADLIILVILGVVLLKKKRFRLIPWPPGSSLYTLYFLFSALSVVNAGVMIYSGFELLKMLRMFVYFWVLCQYIQDEKQLYWFLNAVGVVFLYVFYTMLKQKYLMGMWQAKGPFPHQNSLVMYINMLNCIVFSYVLNVKKKNVLLSLVWMGLLCCGILCTIFTFSRGGMLFLGLGLAMVFGASMTPRQISVSKISIALLAVLAGSAILYKAMDSISERFETAPEESMEVREVLAIAAVNMANDKWFGVGLNNFGLKINPPYWYGNHIPRKEVDPLDPYDEEEKGGLVETIYLMIAAETGWHNLGIYLMFIWGYVFRAIWLYFKSDDPLQKAMALGIACGLTSIYLESAFEWVLKQSNNYYQLMLIFVLVIALERIHNKPKAQVRLRKTVSKTHAKPVKPQILHTVLK